MTGLRSSILTLALCAVLGAVSCGDSAVTPPSKDAGDDRLGVDLVIPDTCACHDAKECDGKVTVDSCTMAACEACACVAKPKAAGATCDDGDAKTVKDACDGKGVCKGVPPTCGDKKCDSAAGENCDNCAQDCGCKGNSKCYKEKCVPCGNGKCEDGEDCETCPKDCGCSANKTCFEKVCTACTDYCTKKGKNCGISLGCKCGECKVGEACDQLNHCYETGLCNNGTCDPGEDCSQCAVDCKCDAKKGCVAGKCVDCAQACKDSGSQCGTYGNCNCGTCGACHKCVDNKCVASSQSCVCYNKECGKVEDFDCGTCPAGKECYGNKCLVGCEALCEGVECGLSQDCFCAYCDGCDQCIGKKCVGAAPMDENEINDWPDMATDLGNVTDSTGAGTIQGSIDVDFDEDWYVVHVQDKSGGLLVPAVELTGLAEDKNLNVEICFKCDKGELAGAQVIPDDGIELEPYPDLPGARCFGVIRFEGMDEKFELRPTCASGGQDDSGTVWFHVVPAFKSWDCGSAYTLKWSV
jgi:hypothetical protein